MVAASELGSERVSNGRERMSQRGQRTSFKSLLILIRNGDMKNERLAVYDGA